MDRSKMRLKAVVFPAFVVFILLCALLFREDLNRIVGTPERLETLISDLGWFGPFALVLAQFIQVVVFVIPGEVVQIAAGYLYGVAGGVALSALGILTGSLFNFAVGRWFGTAFVQALAGEHFERFQRLSHKSGPQAGFFLLFVIPGIPKDILCYVGGVSDLGLGFFLAVSMVGRLPGILGSALIGHSAAQGRVVLAAAILGLAVVLLLVGVALRPRFEQWLAHRHQRNG